MGCLVVAFWLAAAAATLAFGEEEEVIPAPEEELPAPPVTPCTEVRLLEGVLPPQLLLLLELLLLEHPGETADARTAGGDMGEAWCSGLWLPSDSSLGSDDGGVGGSPKEAELEEDVDWGSILMFSLDMTILAGCWDGMVPPPPEVVQIVVPFERTSCCWFLSRLCEAGVSWRVPFLCSKTRSDCVYAAMLARFTVEMEYPPRTVPLAPAPVGDGGQLELGDMGSSLTVISSISMSDATLPELEEDESLRLLL